MGMPFVRMGEFQGVGSFVLRLVVYFPDWGSAFGGRFPAVFIFRGHSGLPARERRDLNPNLTKLGLNYLAATGQ